MEASKFPPHAASHRALESFAAHARIAAEELKKAGAGEPGSDDARLIAGAILAGFDWLAVYIESATINR
jgi:hypothetical protein